MFDHRLLATDGLYPGITSHFSIGVLGTFLLDIIVIPPKKNDLGYYDLEYEVIIRIRRKDKVWEQRRFVSYFTGKSIENIKVVFNKIHNLASAIVVNAKYINTYIDQITASIRRKL